MHKNILRTSSVHKIFPPDFLWMCSSAKLQQIV